MGNQITAQLMVDLSGWTKVPSCRNIFVKPDGSVRSNCKQLKASPDKHGYPVIKYYLEFRNKKGFTRKVHHLVAEAFLGPRPDRLIVNHKNGIKTDNRIENLEYVTKAYNTMHGWDKREFHKIKLPLDVAKKFFHMEAEGFNHRQIAERLSVSRSVVSSALCGEDRRRGLEHLVEWRKTHRKFRKKRGSNGV